MWIWSKLSSIRWQDAWEERFAACGGAVITTIPGRKTQRIEVYCDTCAQAKEIQMQFGGSLRELRARNWAAMKPAQLPPVKVRDRLVISAESSKVALQKLAAQYPSRLVISIPPHLAFGTGHHATTATVLRFLVDFAKERQGTKWSLLDLGTGSGVLAIAGARLGATQVSASDNDPHAVRIAAANARRNRARDIDVSELDVLTWKPRRRWDCVTANIFSSILEQAFPAIAKAVKRDGVVLVSGILKSQKAECLAAGRAAGLRFDHIVTHGKWVTARGVPA